MDDDFVDELFLVLRVNLTAGTGNCGLRHLSSVKSKFLQCLQNSASVAMINDGRIRRTLVNLYFLDSRHILQIHLKDICLRISKRMAVYMDTQSSLSFMLYEKSHACSPSSSVFSAASSAASAGISSKTPSASSRSLLICFASA